MSRQKKIIIIVACVIAGMLAIFGGYKYCEYQAEHTRACARERYEAQKRIDEFNELENKLNLETELMKIQSN